MVLALGTFRRLYVNRDAMSASEMGLASDTTCWRKLRTLAGLRAILLAWGRDPHGHKVDATGERVTM